MAEVENTPATPEASGNDALQNFLDKYHLDSLEKADEVLGSLKNDVSRLKNDKKELSGVQKEYERLKAEAEQRRQAELTEVEKLSETVGLKDKTIEELTGKVAAMEKARIQDKVLFAHAKDKTLLGTRMKLYEVAAKTQEWDSADALKEIFANIDKEFDAELKASNIKLPAPGDGSAGGPTGETQYDQTFFKTFGR